MDQSTGCISIAVGKESEIEVDRVVEFFRPRLQAGTLWVDVFFHNPSPQPQSLIILHRGTFAARDVTRESWTEGNSAGQVFERSLTRRLKKLHEGFDPIRATGDSILVAGVEYRIPDVAPTITDIVEADPLLDVPFSMWELHGFPGPLRQVLRLRLDMGQATLENRLGKSGEFYAYGEAILLNKIQYQDLPSYEGPCADEFREAFKRFLAARHAVPDKFEYLLVADDDTDLAWDATVLSANLSTRWIAEPDLRRNTLWFVTGMSGAWRLAGTRKQNDYALRFTSERGDLGTADASGAKEADPVLS
jgi:hypothetical protein